LAPEQVLAECKKVDGKKNQNIDSDEEEQRIP
jgi:hypothetical protein